MGICGVSRTASVSLLLLDLVIHADAHPNLYTNALFNLMDRLCLCAASGRTFMMPNIGFEVLWLRYDGKTDDYFVA